MKVNHSSGGLVYSTEGGRMCPACRKPMAQCLCGQQTTGPSTDGFVRVSRETKGRNGKAVTLVKGLPLDHAALTAQAKSLKAACGSGGTLKDGVIEVQGDHVARVIALLMQQGFGVKRAGG